MSICKTTRLEIERIVGQLKGWAGSCINGKREKEKGPFPRETCELLVVRGTISFCNNKITILPVGESAAWNVQM